MDINMVAEQVKNKHLFIDDLPPDKQKKVATLVEKLIEEEKEDE